VGADLNEAPASNYLRRREPLKNAFPARGWKRDDKEGYSFNQPHLLLLTHYLLLFNI
jgi:hypothetical protein